MNCQLCKKKEFSVLLKVLVSGRIKTLKLCDECAAKKGYSYEQSLPTAGDYAEKIIIQEYIPKKKKRLICPACGYTYLKLTQTGYLGCPLCYFYFKKELKTALEKFNFSRYEASPVFVDIKKFAARLNRERKAAIEKKISICLHFKDFETAQKLKKELELLENEEL